jgi:photosystem II stability/assembly factor-like uncharacterized protein
MRALTLAASAVLTVLAAASAIGAQDLDPSLLSALEARGIGPAGMSGRIAAIAGLSSDPNVLWVGAATGGVWKSTNGGTSWEPVFDHERVSGIGAIAINQSAPDIVWVGTGEGNPRNSAGVGAGLYKTMDGGVSWTLLGFEESERIHRIVLHPTDPQTAWVGVMGPAWSDGKERGVYKTTDGGQSWRRVLWVNERTGVSDLVIDPRNPMKLYAGMWEFRREPWFFTSGGPGSGLWVSHDGGERWTRYSEADGMPAGELGRIGLSVAPGDPDRVYALVEAETSALLRSSDGGRSWETVNDSPGVASRPFYFADIFVDPDNELRVYNLNSRLLLSEDGGSSFERLDVDVHSDLHAIWIDPNDTRHLLLGTDGGVWESRDRAKSWRVFDNLPVGQFYHVTVDDAIPYNVYGGMQDNGSWRGPSDVWEVGGIRNFHWREVAFGDGFNTLLDPSDPELGYGMSQGGNLVRFDLRTGERKSIRPWAPDSTKLRFNWNAAIALDPFEPGTLYYGSQFVHKSPDRGDSWQIVSPDLTSNDPEKQRQAESGGLTIDATGAENHTTLTALAASPVEQGVIWAGSDDGRVHLSRVAGGTWEDLTDKIGGVPDDTWIPHIEASKHAGGRAYVVFDDHRRGNWAPYLFRTDDYGEHWDNIGKKRGIDGFLHTIEEDPLTPNLLFAGGELGLFVSIDAGRHWFRWTAGLPTVPVRSLVVHPRDHDLVIGTHGRSIWILDDIRPLRALARDPALAERGLHLFETPPAYVRYTAAVDGYHFAGDAMFRGTPRPEGALLTYWIGADGAEEASIRIKDEDGRLVREFTGPATHGMNRVSWDLREDVPQDTSSGRSGRNFGAPRAPQALPGSYTVTVRAYGIESTQMLELRPDPRVDIPAEERRAKHDAILRGLALDGRLSGLRRARREVRDGLARVRELLASESVTEADALREAMSALDERLAEVGDFESARRYRRSISGLGSSYDRPTEGQRLDLRRMEEALDRLEAEMNIFLAGEVERFRARIIAAGVEVFPAPTLVGS